MKVPNTFVKEGTKELTEERLEESIKKILVDKVLVENISQELKRLLESDTLAKRIGLNFRRIISVEEREKECESDKLLYPYAERPSQIINNIKLSYEKRVRLFKQDVNRLLEKIIGAEPSLQEENILQKTDSSLGVITKDMIYELNISYHTEEKHVETGTKEKHKVSVYKRRLRHGFKKKLIREEVLELPVVKSYHNLTFYGSVRYAKFNHEHNAKLINILKELGYEVTLNFFEDKK